MLASDTPELTPALAQRIHRHHVVIIGSGFGGLFAAKQLRKANVDVTLIAKTTHHLFQPLLYQVATGILSEGEIAPSTRLILKNQHNASVVLGDVTTIDIKNKAVTSRFLERTTVTEYDSIIVAAGAGQSYFGNDHFAEYAPGMKTIDDALELRGRILGAFDQAEAATDPAEIERLLTFVVVGAGPTGVEMAGQIAELAHKTLDGTYRHIDSRNARIILLDAAPKVLPPFADSLGQAAAKRLSKMGVDIQLGAMVVDVDADGLSVKDADGTIRRISARTKVWSAGVAASPLGKQLADQSGAEVDRAGRVLVGKDLTLPGHPEVFVVGDMMSLDKLPGVAQVAIQGGRYAARVIEDGVEAVRAGRKVPARSDFKYFDKGSMATVSRFSAVAQVGPIKITGFIAWVMWLLVHLLYIVGFRSRLTTVISWLTAFFSKGRGQLAVTEQQVEARAAMVYFNAPNTSDAGIAVTAPEPALAAHTLQATRA
ncbi:MULTISPECIES: NAD(P)/FAD-dependent oxidoreductase [unclassified Rhodococcus (in: high G+C Gram-positive bacteria)]|uniref:NAD(P)/FAD-dependent oxidoreductase n=1 Tax=unclassified Rhodococcus (in: high G+C Gram-positive bacteria) TaxID=192944 RepID=UPI000B9BB5E9|nr:MULTISPECIES: NAD(P)/FAD-dependent oxidoreductase [unclassified Rhodococcus (in: high G+C Gram-positive bacteria)]OZE37531.1 FAD-dependent oxidoreductase [Rhodococcus sp. 05-2254-4]OZE40664.1 FAD-dependent oxidoreductase [Rhodococcus sp. 05-2254-3]OZE45656.1 FAD-dependent oxidoreductase [Rhodococcus sp. 05-2254-2]